MKRAVALPQYSDTKDFVPPPGVVQVQLDKATNLVADASCPVDYDGAFLDGTQPTDTCDHANGDQRNLFQRIFGLGEKPGTAPPAPRSPAAITPQQPLPSVNNTIPMQQQNSAQQQQQQPEKKKRGFFSRLFGKKDKDDSQQNTEQSPQNPQ